MPKILTLMFLVLFTSFAGAVAAQESQPSSQISHLCAGVGDDANDPKFANYNTKIIFTTAGSAYITDVQAKIVEASSGKVVADLYCDASWLLMNLKAGAYRITATAVKKYTQSAQLTVGGDKQSVLAIRFPQIKGDGI